MESGKTPNVPFNIFTNTRHHHLKVISDEIAFLSSTTSLGKSIKQFNILFVEECQMLIQMIYQPTSPYGLNLEFGYFYMWKFFIKGCNEFHGVGFWWIHLIITTYWCGAKILSRGL